MQSKDPHLDKLMARDTERRKAEAAEKRAIAADERAIAADLRSIRLEEELRTYRKRGERRDRITLVFAVLATIATTADIILRAVGLL